MSTMCYPYGSGITCVCDGGGNIFRCFPDLGQEAAEATKRRRVADRPAGIYREDFTLLDGGTELVLAVTFLVLVVLIFVGFICYKCERALDHTKQPRQAPCPLNHTTRVHCIEVEVQTDLYPALATISSSSEQQITHSSLQDYAEECDMFNQLMESGYGTAEELDRRWKEVVFKEL